MDKKQALYHGITPRYFIESFHFVHIIRIILTNYIDTLFSLCYTLNIEIWTI